MKREKVGLSWLVNHKYVVVLGGIIAVVLVVLLSRNANVTLMTGDGAKSTTRPVSSEAQNNGRSAAAGDHGAATAGDHSPAVSVSGNSNVIQVITCNVGADVLCNRAIFVPKETEGRPLGVFEHYKWLKGSAEFDAAIGVSGMPTLIELEMATDLIASTVKTMEAMNRRDRYEAIARAERTRIEACRLMDYNVPFSEQAKQALADAVEGPCESAWFRREYDVMGDYASRIVDVCGFPPPIRALAYKRLGELLKVGCEFYEPSLDELMMLKGYGKAYAYTYLNLFAKWGYLRQRRMVGEASTVDYYKDFFGFDDGLEFRQTVCFRRNDGRGGELVSNEISVLSLGLGSYRYFDLTDAYAKCCGWRTNPAAKLGVEFDTGMKFDEWEIAMALAKISLKDGSEVEMNVWNEEGFVVAGADAFEFPQTDEPEVYFNEEIAKDYKRFCMEPQPVPEPSSDILLLIGLIGLGLRRKT